ncbi:hypothetical protein GWI33_018840 [Rhynchophorus ferrugineus]|uniref:Uncharacterized protein n=1 Tax=Rhynchophorus ferrugineus TaxID=354439 RepID=A0A834HW57_RHYFE|nr:hypothetical protein GWI33_018840 [Rhynchophorus ferrugineus]
MLYCREYNLNCFHWTDRGLLVENDKSPGSSRSDHVIPFYMNCSDKNPFGHEWNAETERFSRFSSKKTFPITAVVHSHAAFAHHRKILTSPYNRDSRFEFAKPSAIVDLDEIIPVVEEAASFNNNPRGRYPSEGDLLVLDPLLLEIMPRKRPKAPLTDSEQNKIARITITYVLAFFALVLTTFFIIYLA